jgi:hypothetical protein
MLFSIMPASYVHFSVFPFVLTLPMKLVIFELTYVFDSIVPNKFAKAVHFVCFPVALILFLVLPYVDAVAFKHSIFELTLEAGSIGHLKQSFSVLRIILKQALVLGSILPHFNTLTLFFSNYPLAFVADCHLAFLSHLNELSIAVCSSFIPASFVDISVCFSKHAMTMWHVVPPLSFVRGSIDCPDHGSISVFDLFNPLSFVHVASLWTRPHLPQFSKMPDT